MKFETIIEAWKEDSKIDNSNLGNESLKTPNIHSKYIDWLTREAMVLTGYYSERKKLKRLLIEYYNGTMPMIQLKELGWEPFMKKILKSDVNDYVESDDRMTDLALKIANQERKINLLEDIIKQIHNRGFTIKNAIDFLKWSMGS